MQWIVGDARITAIHEQPLEHIEMLMPNVTVGELQSIDWLSPHFIDPDGTMIGVIQCFVIETGGKTLVVDTCVGDDKDLPFTPALHEAKTGFLQRFRVAGFDPAKVDMVLCTHMHLDHVGWNTLWDGAGWHPTFPHARYLFARKELDFWTLANAGPIRRPIDADNGELSVAELIQGTQRNVHRELIQPIFDAGLAELVDAPTEPVPGVHLVPTPGHTPGHVSVRIESAGATAFITGDSFHHPCQLARPGWGTIADSDPALGVDTRAMILEDLVDTSALMLGSHFAEPTAGRIVRDGSAYRLDWTHVCNLRS